MTPRSIPSPPDAWSHFQVGIFTIHAYALCILVAIFVASALTAGRLTARGAERGLIWDFAIWTIPLSLIGARAYHVFTHIPDYFGPGLPLWKVFAIWEGGNAIFGSLLGGALGVLLACRMTGVRFLVFADALAPGLLLAQAIGRLGNWFNTELYGLPTDLPWGLEVPSTNAAFPVGLAPGTLFHPTFLYEMVWNTAGALLILAVEHRVRRPLTLPPRFDRRLRLNWGAALGVYLVWYGVGRSVFESIRIDPTTVYLGLRVNVWTAFAAVLIGLVLLALAARHPGVEPSAYRPGRQPKGAGAVRSRYTEADFEPEPPAERGVEAATSGAARP